MKNRVTHIFRYSIAPIEHLRCGLVLLEDENFNLRVTKDSEEFTTISNVIITNGKTGDPLIIDAEIYTRDFIGLGSWEIGW